MAASIRIENGLLEAPMRDLARLYSVPLKTLCGWKNAGVDVRSPIDVAHHVFSSKMLPKSWSRSSTESAGETATPSRQEKMRQEIRRIKAEADKAERMLEMLDGHYLPRSEVENQQACIGHVWNALLRAVSSELPPICAGLPAPAIEVKTRDWCLTWAERLSNADSLVWKAAEKKVESDLRGDLRKVAAAKSRTRNETKA